MILLSACLYGLPCRYDGRSKPDDNLRRRLQGQALLIVCPEQLGGLPTPRPPAELTGGDGHAVMAGTARVVRCENSDNVTEAFRVGAKRTLRLCRACGVTRAVLKSKSPSCGLTHHYENGELIRGPGVTAAALIEAGLAVEEA